MVEGKKKLIFNNIKPEDCVFGDSLGEGINLDFVLTCARCIW